MRPLRRALSLFLSFILTVGATPSWAFSNTEADVRALQEAYIKAMGNQPGSIEVTSKTVNGITTYHTSINRCDGNGVCQQVYSKSYRESVGFVHVDGQYYMAKTIDGYENDNAISLPIQIPASPRHLQRIDYIAGYSKYGSNNKDPDSFEGNLQMRVRPPSEIPNEISQVLPSVAGAFVNSYQDLQNAINTSKALHQAYLNNLKALASFTQNLETNRQNFEKSSATNDAIAAFNIGFISRQVDTSTASTEQMRDLDEFERVKADPFTFKQYDLTDLALEDLQKSTNDALIKRDVRTLARNAEIGLSQRESAKRVSFKEKNRDVFRNGIVQIQNINPQLGPGPLDSRSFQINAQTPAGQALRRVGNLAQTYWFEQNGFQETSTQSKSAYLAALTNLSSAENFFINGDFYQGYESLRETSKLLQASIGFTKGLYHAGKDTLMAIPMVAEAAISLGNALARNPGAVADQATDLLLRTPEIGAAILKRLHAYGEKFLNGDIETRAEITGRVAGEIIILFATSGSLGIAQKLGSTSRVGTQASRISSLIEPSTSLGSSIIRKAELLEPKLTETILAIQKSSLPGTSWTGSVDRILNAFDKMNKSTFPMSAEVLPEIIKHRRLLMDIRNGYNRDVAKIGEYVSQARASGESLESIARNAHGMRRSIGEVYKNQTPELVRREIYGRNLYIYGDELGPKFHELVKNKRLDSDLNDVYESIIRSSQKTNSPLNELLNTINRELN
ncbi:cell wall binding repeat-containing protein [Bdellovibrio bacteriovorus W]|nr:cell wall binding repeat-containing protein [Bdellovibrio bacteriovorus W]